MEETTIQHNNQPSNKNKTNTHKQGEQSVVGWKEREGAKVPKNGALNGVFETPSRVLKQTKFDMWHFPQKAQVGFYWKQYRGVQDLFRVEINRMDWYWVKVYFGTYFHVQFYGLLLNTQDYAA